MEGIQDKIDAGAEALTAQFFSDNWVDGIDLDSLDLGHIFHCVLGQLFGGFLDAPSSLYKNREEYGFYTPHADLYPLLTGLWVLKIREIKRTRETQA